MILDDDDDDDDEEDDDEVEEEEEEEEEEEGGELRGLQLPVSKLALRAAVKAVRGIFPRLQTKYKQVKYKELHRMQEVEIVETIFCEC